MSKKTEGQSNRVFIYLSFFEFEYIANYTSEMKKTTKNISKNHALPVSNQGESEVGSMGGRSKLWITSLNSHFR
jgi:hypothetical protein